MKQTIITIVWIVCLVPLLTAYLVNKNTQSTVDGVAINQAMTARCHGPWVVQFQSGTSTVGYIGCLSK